LPALSCLMIISDAHFLELADGENAVPRMLFRFGRVEKGQVRV